MDGLLTFITPRLEDEANTLKMVIGMLRNATENQEMGEQQARRSDSDKVSLEAAHCDRAVAWEQAFYLCITMRKVEEVIASYRDLIHQTKDLGAIADAKTIHNLLELLTTSMNQHKDNLPMIHRLISNVQSLETYSLNKAMYTDSAWADFHAAEVLENIRKMQRGIHEYRYKLSNPSQDIHYIDLTKDVTYIDLTNVLNYTDLNN